jgi:DNA-binding CsgD family transcriptional regulator
MASPLEILSDRELEAFQLLGRGYGPSQTVEKLHLSVRTVEANGARIRAKLNLESASEFVQYAIQLNSGKETQAPVKPLRRTGRAAKQPPPDFSYPTRLVRRGGIAGPENLSRIRLLERVSC